MSPPAIPMSSDDNDDGLKSNNNNNGNDNDNAAAAATPRIRSKLACEACRGIKVRCLRPPEPNTACARCARYGLQCTDPPVTKPKGRPPRLTPRQQQQQQHAMPSASSVQCTPSRRTRASDWPSPPGILISDFQPPLLSNSQAQAQAQARTQQQQQPPDMLSSDHLLVQPAPGLSATSPSVNFTSLPTPDPAATAAGSMQHPLPVPRSTNSLNIAELLDPEDRAMQASAPKAPFFTNVSRGRTRVSFPSKERMRKLNDGDDPVLLKAVSEVEANWLVQLFHERLNPLVSVLDPNLHTVQYLRSTSPILFSTVLACSSRFFRKDLHPNLLSHARTALDRAVLTSVAEVGLVQSLMLLTYWNDPLDTSGWMKIGIAIRLGYSMFWHLHRSDPLPDNEADAREILNTERTWFCLFSFDRNLSYVYGLPAVLRVNDHADPEIWARSHLYLRPDVDMHIAASIEFCKLKDHWGGLCDVSSNSSFQELAIDTLTKQCYALIAKWFNREAPPPCFEQEAEHVLLWSIFDFIFIMKRYSFEMSASAEHGDVVLKLDACLGIVSRIADEIDILANNGMLVIMQDSASSMTSALVVFLRKAFRISTPSQKSYMLTLLHRVLLSHTGVTNEHDDTAPAYVARFIRRVLSALRMESRPASPGLYNMSSTEGEGEFSAPEEEESQIDFFAALGLEEFAEVPPFVAQSEGDDGLYWANMLGVPVES